MEVFSHCVIGKFCNLKGPGRATKVNTLILNFKSFTEIYFTYHKIHPFKVYSSVIFSIFTELCNHYQNLQSTFQA